MRGLALLQGIVKHLLVRYLKFVQLREIFIFAFSATFLKRIAKLISSKHLVNDNEQNLPNGYTELNEVELGFSVHFSGSLVLMHCKGGFEV